jgi:hypothetical protein
MPTVIPNSRTVLSVYPIDLEKYCRMNGLITFRHPAAKRDSIIVREYSPEWMSSIDLRKIKKDEPLFRDVESKCTANDGHNLIRVYDTFTWVRDFTQDTERFMPMPITAEQVAQTLVTAWSSDVIEGSGDAGPGIMLIAGDTPTASEKSELMARQIRYARRLINSAVVLHAKQDVKNISDLHRAMAAWMGVKDRRAYPWIAAIEQTEMKACRACGEQIRQEALRCKECNVDLVDFYVKHGIVPSETEDPYVFNFINSKVQQKNKVA